MQRAKSKINFGWAESDDIKYETSAFVIKCVEKLYGVSSVHAEAFQYHY
jgi:hypothetical protein